MDDNDSQGSVHSQTSVGDRQKPAQHYSQPLGLYQHSSGTATPVSVSSSRHMINPNYQPGKSGIGYENVAFTRGSGSIEGSVHFPGNVDLRYVTYLRYLMSSIQQD